MCLERIDEELTVNITKSHYKVVNKITDGVTTQYFPVFQTTSQRPVRKYLRTNEWLHEEEFRLNIFINPINPDEIENLLYDSRYMVYPRGWHSFESLSDAEEFAYFLAGHPVEVVEDNITAQSLAILELHISSPVASGVERHDADFTEYRVIVSKFIKIVKEIKEIQYPDRYFELTRTSRIIPLDSKQI